MTRSHLTLIIICLLFSSCNQSIQHLKSLEQSIRANPDSVLIELSTMKSKHTSPRVKAYHALLTISVLDQKNVVFNDDSLISISSSYYKQHGSPHLKMMNWYYQGLVERDLGRYASAILSLAKAASLAKYNKELLYEGLAHRTLSEIFSSQYEDFDATKEILESITCFERAALPEYAESSRLDYADILQQKGERDRADSVYKIVIRQSQDYPLVNQAYKSYAYSLQVNNYNDAVKVIDLFQRGEVFGYGAGDYAKMAYAYSFINPSKTDSLLSEAYHCAYDIIDTARIYYFESLISQKDNNYNDALKSYKKSASIQDSIVTLKLQQSLTSSLNDIYKKDNRILRLRQQVARRNAIIALIIALLCIGCLAWRLIVKSRKNRDLSESIAEARRILQEREDGNLRLAKALVLEKIDQVQHAQERYMAAQGSEEEQAAYMDFRKQLGLLKNDRRLYANLATVLDEQYDGIATKVREDFPKMTDNNYELFLLLLAHFPQSTILLLKDATPGSLKTAKSRLRSALRKSDSPRKETYLSMLDN